MLQQEIFFKRYGARLPIHLLKPNVFLMERFEFPKNSIHHYAEFDGIRSGPDSNDYLYRKITKKIFVAHQTELTGTEGAPRRLGIAPMTLIRLFHIQNKRFRISPDITKAPTDENTLGIENYCLLPKLYRYVRSVFAEYYKWRNIESTVWEKMHSIAQNSSRTQYYFLDLPKTLPSVSRLNMASERFSQNTLNYFNSKESLSLLELWKWLSEKHRGNSVLGDWTTEEYKKVNIVIRDSGSWTMFNLGLLNEWRYVEGVSSSDQKIKLSPDQMQKRFLRAMIFLMSYRTKTVDEEESSTNDENVKDGLPEDSDINEAQVQDSSVEEYEDMLKSMDADLKQLELIETESDELIRARTSDPNTDELIKKPTETAKPSELPRSEIRSKLLSKIDDPAPDSDVKVSNFETKISVTDSIKDKINNLADDGLIDGSEYRRKTKLIEKYEALPSPFDPAVLLKDFIEVKPESLVISDNDPENTFEDSVTVIDKSMLKSTLQTFDKNYVKKVMDKDISAMAMATQRAGFIVTDYDVETMEDAIGAYRTHTMRITPIEGTPSTLRFKLPLVNENGQYTSSNTTYVMRKQRIDLPIRKINPTRVALTSYYGKNFVTRSERRSNNYALWLHNQISSLSLQDDPTVVDIHPSNVFDSEFVAPRAYTSLAQYFKTFRFRDFALYFDHLEREQIFEESIREKYEKNGSILFGIRADKALLLMDKNSTIYQIEKGEFKPLGNIEEFLGLNSLSAPVEFAEARIFGKNIPLGLVLGYKLGLSNLIKLLGVEPRRVPVGHRTNLQPHEYSIVFSDETLVFSRDDSVAAMVLAGFQQYEKTTKNYSVYVFDKTGVYLKLLEQFNLGVRYLREIDLLDEMFVDPITEGILRQMKEPLTYRGLLIRSCELLMTDYHKNPLDMQQMRIRGYERFAGAVYTEVVNAVREHRGKPNRKNSSIDLHPHAVWKRVVQDSSALPINELNPIQYLKEVEAVVYSGTGGRTSRAMVKRSRDYHDNDTGVISEATSDSSDVGINTFLVPNPKFTSLRGMTEEIKVGESNPSSMISTSALSAVASNQDSVQRVNMISIQQSHSIGCSSYQPSSIRTGYEEIITKRVDDTFAKSAKEDGIVTAITDDSVVVEYKDKKLESFPIGRKFGKASDLTIPHELRTDFKVGDKVAKGDIVSYNTNFFERDKLNPKAVVWKNAILTRVALLESRQTHEDASSISRETANLLSTRTTKIKNVVINFDQHVRNVMQVGDKVDYNTVLCYIEDNITASNKLFDEDSLNTLKNLSNQAPMAKADGVIEKIEVFYHGDIEDMTPSLQEMAIRSDKETRKIARNQLKKPFSGQVDEAFHIKGETLQLDSLVIRFYITGDIPAGVGDKGVFGNQLKTVFSEVMDYDVRTESGQKIDAIFGAQSVFNRIVNSAFVIGTTNNLLEVIGKKAAKIYKGK